MVLLVFMESYRVFHRRKMWENTRNIVMLMAQQIHLPLRKECQTAFKKRLRLSRYTYLFKVYPDTLHAFKLIPVQMSMPERNSD